MHNFFLKTENRLSVGAPEPPLASDGWELRPHTPAYYYNLVDFLSSAKCVLLL